jgi:epsilon-lactone hydrolase
MSGSIYTHRKMFGHLAKAAGVRAQLVSYRLLPDGVFPVPEGDVTDAYRWLLDQGSAPAASHSPVIRSAAGSRSPCS